MNNNKFYCICGKSFRKKHYFISHKQVCEGVTICEKQNNVFDKYIYTSFKNIEFINNVPKVVYVCWFGIENDLFPLMSENRFNAFQNLVENIGVPVILLTEKNYKFFIKDDYPLHDTFNNLSGVHKSDYFRCYMLLHYGGGYHDIKFRNESWENCWNDDEWLHDENLWMYGRREKNRGAIAHPPGSSHIKSQYKKLATMGWIICKPYTLYLYDLVEEIEKKLDYHRDNLIKYPAKKPGYYSDKPFDLVPENSYPIRWLEILGEIFHPLMLKHNKHIKFGLPDAVKSRRYK